MQIASKKVKGVKKLLLHAQEKILQLIIFVKVIKDV